VTVLAALVPHTGGSSSSCIKSFKSMHIALLQTEGTEMCRGVGFVVLVYYLL
jgi:hypothetical protein